MRKAVAVSGQLSAFSDQLNYCPYSTWFDWRIVMNDKTKDKTKLVDNALIGNAGEFYVMAELLKRGWIAGLTPRNARAFDILASKKDKILSIRVKTKSKGNWQWSVNKQGDIFHDLSVDNDFTVLVNLGKINLDEMFYVLKTIEINEWLKTNHEQFLQRGGKDNPRRSLSSKEAKLESYKNWNILWVQS